MEAVHLWPELDDGEGMGGEALKADFVGIADEVNRDAVVVEPAGEGEGAAFRAAHIDDLGGDDGSGVGGGFGHDESTQGQVVWRG